MVSAATELWRQELGEVEVCQFLVDGANGCAVMLFDLDLEIYYIKLYDKKGVMWKSFSNSTWLRIVYNNKHYLLYEAYNTVTKVREVHRMYKKTGADDLISNPSGEVYADDSFNLGDLPYNPSAFCDGKVFFTIMYNSATDGKSAIVAYKLK
jgi:hypothetical protein